MLVRLPPKDAEIVDRLVAGGNYRSEAEVIRAALRLLAYEVECQADARRKIATGMEQLRSGYVVDGEKAVRGVIRRLRRGER